MSGAAKVFGIGLSRTGTTSLTRALEHLGYKTVHYPHDPVTLAELSGGVFRLSVLDAFDAVTDITVAPYYPQLDSAYPGSKFVLTVRNIEQWLVSMAEHFDRLGPHLQQHPEMRPFTDFICAAVYGTQAFDRERMKWVYETHVQNVRSFFRGRPDNLLEVDICSGSGWAELCSFLGRPMPDMTFPFLNRGKNDRPGDNKMQGQRGGE
jgi:hypothetical protein